jgi:hypothetical protein
MAVVPRLPTAARCALVVELSDWWSGHGLACDGNETVGLWALALAARAGGASALLPAGVAQPYAGAWVSALAAIPAVLAGGEAAGPALAIRRALVHRRAADACRK